MSLALLFLGATFQSRTLVLEGEACCHRWELPLLNRERLGLKDVKIRCSQLLLSKGSPLPCTQSHLCQDAAVVASPLYVPSTRAVPSVLCVTTGHLCWSRTSLCTWSADCPPCPLHIGSWDRPERVHVFLLCLNPNTYQDSVAHLSPLPSVQRPSAAAWQEANERKDFKGLKEKTREEDGREHLRFRRAVLCFEALFQCAWGSWWEGHSEELSL